MSIHPRALGIELGWSRGLAPFTMAAAKRLQVGWLRQCLLIEPLCVLGSPLLEDWFAWERWALCKLGLQAIASWVLGQYLACNLESPGPIQTRRESLVSSYAGYGYQRGPFVQQLCWL